MADYEYIREQGLIIPDTSTIRADVEQEFRDVFGAGILLEPSTPTGAIAARIIETRDAIARNNAQVANQINPDVASGVFLDAIAALSGISRQGQAKTKITIGFTGVNGTVVPKGTRVQDDNGNIFATDADVTIGPGPHRTATAVMGGSIPVPASSFLEILDDVLGLYEIYCYGGSVGADGQNDAEFRVYRREALALQGSGGIAAIESRLMATPGVVQTLVVENSTNNIVTWKETPLSIHSIWCIVDGGSDEDVGEAIIATKSPGCNITSPDERRKTYQKITPSISTIVEWTAARSVPVWAKIKVKEPDRWERQVVQAVTEYAAGKLDGDKPGRIGQDLSPWEIAGAINQVYPQITVLSVELSTDGNIFYPAVVACAKGYDMIKIDTEDIRVV